MNKTTIIVWSLIVFVLGLSYVMWGVMWEVEPVEPTVTVSTGEVLLSEIREKMAENDVIIMRGKSKKDVAQKVVDQAIMEVEEARSKNRELEKQRVALINWAEQTIVYQTTGEATSWLHPTTE